LRITEIETDIDDAKEVIGTEELELEIKIETISSNEKDSDETTNEEEETTKTKEVQENTTKRKKITEGKEAMIKLQSKP
jgi:hypothetical protein